MQETMTREERFDAAFQFTEKPDRLPVAPLISGYASAGWAGKTFADAHNPDLGLEMMFKAFDDLGGWDALYFALPILEEEQILLERQPMRVLVPGRDLPVDYVNQPHEEEILKVEDYDTIIDIGFDRFWNEDYLFRITNWTESDIQDKLKMLERLDTKAHAGWSERGVAPFCGWGEFHPFFQLSLARSFVPFSMDVYSHVDKLEAVLDRMTDEMIPRCIDIMKKSGRKYFGLAEERSSAYHYPPELFDRLWMPYTKRIVEAMLDEGFYTFFHLDTDFTRNLGSFKQLPKKSFCLALDSTTDIINARKVLGDHCALMGDVPAAMMALGKPEEVEAYCAKLFNEVGKDGGFILCSGCEVPGDAKFENAKAMIDTAKKSFY